MIIAPITLTIDLPNSPITAPTAVPAGPTADPAAAPVVAPPPAPAAASPAVLPAAADPPVTASEAAMPLLDAAVLPALATPLPPAPAADLPAAVVAFAFCMLFTLSATALTFCAPFFKLLASRSIESPRCSCSLLYPVKRFHFPSLLICCYQATLFAPFLLSNN